MAASPADDHKIYADKLDIIYKNLSQVLHKLSEQSEAKSEDSKYDDSSNAYLYILFVLTFYAFSIIVLMIKYIRREREGSKLEFYYNEFVKREWYKDKNLYDATGRRIRYSVDGNKVVRVARSSSRVFVDDPGAAHRDDEDDVATQHHAADGAPLRKKSVVLCVEAASAALSMVSMNKHDEALSLTNLGARPKRSSLKNWPPPMAEAASSTVVDQHQRPTTFHQQSLDDALELRNVNSLENLRSPYMAAKRIDRRLSIAVVAEGPYYEDYGGSVENNVALDFLPAKLSVTKVDGENHLRRLPSFKAKLKLSVIPSTDDECSIASSEEIDVSKSLNPADSTSSISTTTTITNRVAQ
jgi:hypothetical protein